MVDFSQLDEVVDGNSSLVAVLLSHFDETFERCAQQLNELPPHAWSTPCHEIKGAAASIGATATAEFCQQLIDVEELANPADTIEKLTSLKQTEVQALRAHHGI